MSASDQIDEAEFIANLRRAILAVGGAAKFAAVHGVHAQELSYALNGRRRPTIAVAQAMGYRRRIVYEPIT